MNTKSIAGAARVICEAMGRPQAVPATIAVALDAGGWLNLPETAGELERLRAKASQVPVDDEQLAAIAARRTEAVEVSALACWPLTEYRLMQQALKDSAVLLDQVERLRARVAELETAQRPPAGLSEAELSRTASGAYLCVCGHWDNVHGPFCFAEVCECFRFAHFQPVEGGTP